MKSEEDKMIDDFLRETLGNYREQPHPTIWQGIVQKLPYKPLGKYFPGSDGGILATLIGGIIVTAGLVYFFAGNIDSKASKESNKNQAIVENVQFPSSSTADLNRVTTGNQTFSENKETFSSSAKQSLNDLRQGAAISSSSDNDVKNTGKAKGNSVVHYAAPNVSASIFNKHLKSKTTTSGNKSSVNFDSPTTFNPKSTESYVSPVSKAGNQLLPDKIVLFPISAKPAQLLANVNKGFYFSEIRNESSRDLSWLNKSKTEYFPSRGTFCLTAFYQPEYLKGNANDFHAAQRNTAGLSLRYVKNGLVVETGLEHSRESRNQDYNVQYFDYLGTYQNLDSIGFLHQGGEIIPSYYYTTDSVFNPELSEQKFSSKATYSFVKIPVLIGMEHQLGHFSLGLKGGVMFGILVDKNGTVFHNQYPEARIYSFENASPIYKNTNLQWVLKADVDWNITHGFGLTIAPVINGYITDPYNRSKNAVDRPIYWGIQGGVFYKW